MSKTLPITRQSDSGSWHWQIKHTIRNIESLSRILPMDSEEKEAVTRVAQYFPFRITPYYANLIDSSNPRDPIRLQVIPDARELDELKELA